MSEASTTLPIEFSESVVSQETTPVGWTTANLGEVGVWTGGGTPSKRNDAFWINGKIPWISPKDMKSFEISRSQDFITGEAIEKSSAKLIKASSVLMVTRSGILQHTFPVGVNSIEVAVNQDLKAITPHTGINEKYVAWYLVANNNKILANCSKDGTTVQSVDTDQLKSLQIPIAPHKEQNRIVSKIDELFSDIEAGERALARARVALERYRKSVLKAAVIGELTKDWREANKNKLEPADKLLERILAARRTAWEEAELAKMKAKGKTPKDDKWKKKYKPPEDPVFSFLRIVPNEWAAGRIDLFGEVQLGRQRAPKHHTGDHMRPYLRVANVFEERIDTSDVKEMNFTPKEYENYKLHRGDILLNEGQSAELVGRPAIYNDEVPGACFTNTLVRYRVFENLTVDFAMLLFRHFMHSGHFTKIARITTNIAHLGTDRFASMKIPCPSAPEQLEIVSRATEAFSKTNHIEAALDKQERKSKALRQSILKSAFEGRLVPQDISDEPASVLLERLKQNAKPITKNKKKRKNTK